MTREQVEEQLALDSLGLQPRDEKEALDAQVAGDFELRALATDFQAAVEALAFLPVQTRPPAALKQRVLAGIDRRAGPRIAPLPDRPASSVVPVRPLVPVWIPWAIAAALAVCFGATFLELQKTKDLSRVAMEDAVSKLQKVRSQFDDARREAAQAIKRAQTAENKLIEADAGLKRASQEIADLKKAEQEEKVLALHSVPDAKAICGHIVWNSVTKEGLLLAHHMPAIPEEQDYQLWIIDPGHKDPVDAGVFKVRPDGTMEMPIKPKEPITEAQKFAISLERVGGVPKAEGPMVASSP